MASIIRFIRDLVTIDRIIGNTTPFAEQTKLLEYKGFLILNATPADAAKADQDLSVNDPYFSMNQSQYIGFGASIDRQII